MTRRKPRTQSGRWALLLLVGGVACNAIVGIDDPIVVEPPRQTCILNSDCDDERLVCLFETCSPRCLRDVDCGRGEFCLKTADGNGCVSTGDAACGLSDPCPQGTACFDGQCRADCRENAAICLSDQVCDADGACRGPGGSGGSGGSAGNGGAGGGGKSGAGGTSGSGGSGGSGVVAGESGSGGSDAPGGSAGAGGDSGEGGAGGEPVVPGDPCSDPGALKCAGAASSVRLVCEDGEWKAGTPCGNGELCDRGADEAGSCAPIVSGCVGLEPGAAYCDGAERVVCGPDLVSTASEVCASQEHCRQATTAACATCITEEHDCAGDVLRVCNGAHTGFDEVTECTDEPCNALLGRCTSLICEPGEYSCEAGTNTLRRCNDDGTDFESEIDCGTGICDAAGGECDDCAPNEVQSCLDGARKSVCNADGQGTRAVICAEEDPNRTVCIGAGLCRECTPSDAECVDKFRVRTCTSGGSWDSPEVCTGQACAGDRCTGVCVPESRNCVDELSIQVCNDSGQYDPATSCDGQACVNDGCAGECEPGSVECEDQISHKTCGDQGTWGTPVRCDDQACVDGRCVGECTPDALNCVDQFQIQRCGSDGEYGDASSCTGQACYMDQCTGICVPGNRRCLSSTQYQVCGQDGQYPVNGTSCTNSACSGGDCVGNCSPGTQRCAPAPANASQVCNSEGGWDTETTCSPSLETLCRVGGGGDAACVANPSYVVGKSVQFASSTSVSANHLLGNPVTLTEKVRILKFGIIVRAAVANCHVRMALYTNNGGPAARAGFSAATPGANLVAQTYLLDPNQQLTVPAGNYWVMAHYECATTAYANDTASGEPDLRYTTSASYASGPPDPFPSGSTLVTSFALNHFLEVQAVP